MLGFAEEGMYNEIADRRKKLNNHLSLSRDLLHHNWQIKVTWFSIESRVGRVAGNLAIPCFVSYQNDYSFLDICTFFTL